MKNMFKDLLNKSVSELEKELNQLRGEVNKIGMEAVSNPQKDSNLISKKRKQIARVLTALHQKNEEEAFKNKQ